MDWSLIVSLLLVGLLTGLLISADYLHRSKPTRPRGLMRHNLRNGTVVPVEQTDEGKLFDQIAKPECPDCGSRRGFYEGPSGGLSTNIFCINRECRAGFNVTPAIGIADRIHKGDIKRYP
jgi:hypothetical protein